MCWWINHCRNIKMILTITNAIDLGQHKPELINSLSTALLSRGRKYLNIFIYKFKHVSKVWDTYYFILTQYSSMSYSPVFSIKVLFKQCEYIIMNIMFYSESQAFCIIWWEYCESILHFHSSCIWYLFLICQFTSTAFI